MSRKYDYDEEDWWSGDDDDGYHDESDEKEAAEEPPRRPRQFAFSLADALRSPDDPRLAAVPTTTPLAKKPGSEDKAAAAKKPDVRVPVASVAVSAQRDGGALLRRSGKDDLSALDDGSLLCVASFLSLSSIAPLSCVNHRLDVLLSSDFLYCLPRNVEDESLEDGQQGGDGPLSRGLGGGSLLPCLRAAPSHRLLPAAVPPDDPPRPKGVARKYAIESQLYGPTDDPTQPKTRRAFRFVDQVSTDAQPNNMAFLDRRTLAYTTWTLPEVAVRDVISSKTTTVNLPFCADVCKAAFGPKKRLCATLSNQTGGGRGGVGHLTVVDLSPAAAAHIRGGGAGKIIWQQGSDAANVLGATLAFDESEDRLLFGTNRVCRVYDARLGTELWSSKDGFFESCLFHGSSSVVLLKGNAVEVFDVREDGRKCVARARVPGWAPILQAVSLAGKLFVTAGSSLFCLDTGAIGGGGTAASGSDEQRRHGPAGGGEAQGMRKIASLSHGTPSLAVGNGKLYVSVGHRITVLDPKNPTSVWASYELDRPGALDVQRVVVDDTKLVLSARDRGGRDWGTSLNILPIDAFVRSSAGEGGGPPHSIAVTQPYINGPSTFDDRPQTIGKIALKGNFLATSFSWTVAAYESQPTETGALRPVFVRKEESAIRIVNIQREDRDVIPGSYREIKADRERDQQRRQESYERVRKECEKAEADRNRAEAEETLEEDEERKQKIHRRKEAKKEEQRANRAKHKAATRQMSHARGTKKGRTTAHCPRWLFRRRLEMTDRATFLVRMICRLTRLSSSQRPFSTLVSVLSCSLRRKMQRTQRCCPWSNDERSAWTRLVFRKARAGT